MIPVLVRELNRVSGSWARRCCLRYAQSHLLMHSTYQCIALEIEVQISGLPILTLGLSTYITSAMQ